MRGLDAIGSGTGRFEKYSSQFDVHFDTLSDLALACDMAGYGPERIFAECLIHAIGDRARLTKAMQELPRAPCSAT